MKSFPVNGISPSNSFSQAVFLDQQFLIAAPGIPVTADIIKTLSEWGFNEVLSDGELIDEKQTESQIKQESGGGAQILSGDMQQMQQAEKIYKMFFRYTDKLFTDSIAKNKIIIKSVEDMVKLVCGFMRENYRFLMRILFHDDLTEGKQPVFHSMRTSIIAITAGINLKLPNFQLVELGIAALLHDIGMIKLPPRCYLKDRELNDTEKRLKYTHPVMGYNLLVSSNFPQSVCEAVLEHHERENGSGYPRKLTGNKISLYSKIITVASLYEALSEKRPHDEAINGYLGILELLKNKEKQFDENAIRALVNSFSVYPIGLYVLLSDGNKGQVIDVYTENPRYPVVEVFGDETPRGKIFMKTSPDGLSIVRPLSLEEIGE